MQPFSNRKIALIAVLVMFCAAIGAFVAVLGARSLLAPARIGYPTAESASCNVLGIQVHGTIVESRADIFVSEMQPMSTSDGSTYLATPNYALANEITDALRAAATNDSIEGLIIDIESPGGGVVAGKEIADAVRRLEKPTISVIHEVGASSGYLVAAAAQTVYADADSSIGSIGVTASYLSQVEKNKKDGYAYEQLSVGRYKDMMDPNKPLTDAERLIVMRDLAESHAHFVDLVAQYRSLERQKVDALADGSTMLGRIALENKLIDRIGGLDDAIADLENELGKPVSICWQ